MVVREKATPLQTVIMAASFTLLAAVGGYAFNAIDRRMAIAEERIVDLEKTVDMRGERIARIENEMENNAKAHMLIEKKIDLLIEMHINPAVAQKLAATVNKK
jgi:predicted  nucleic acid-binding Zn-ribbon protein